MTTDKPLATLQAAAALRGIVVEQDGQWFVVRLAGRAVWREVPDMGSLVALLASMGVVVE